MARKPVQQRLGDIARAIGADLRGDPQARVDGIAALAQAGPTDLSFLANPRLRAELGNCRAAAVILRPEDAALTDSAVLIVDDPYLAYARATAVLYPPEPVAGGLHPSAMVAADASVAGSARVDAHCVIESGASVGEGAVVGPGCFVGAGARIGEGTRLVANVTVYDGVRIGRRCLLHAGCVIGADGFGFALDGERWVKIPQVGSVVVGDDVEIGANSCVDRGAIGDTVVGDGVIIDNLVQIAHNVVIGENTAIAGCAGIAGSARIGRDCRIGGGAGIAGHLTVADGAIITGMCFVSRSITEPGVYSSGTTAQPNREWHKSNARFQRLDAIARRVADLEQRVAGKRDRGEES